MPIKWKRGEQAPFRGPNRRRSNRYRVRFALKYRRLGVRSGGYWKRGSSLDMSGSGLLLDLSDNLPAGTKLQVVMNWPGLYYDRASMRLAMVVSVVRADVRGTAVRILSHQVHEAKPVEVPLRQNAVANSVRATA